MAIIDIAHDIDKVVKDMDALHKSQLPYAIRVTVNKLAENAKRHMEIKQLPTLDRPTRYTMNMMRVDYAKRGDLTSTVKVKDRALLTKRGSVGPDEVLGHLFTGGQRRGKGYEGLMQRAGILPKGMYTVPGEGVTLDAHGNLPKGLVVQLLAYFRAFQESGFKANMTGTSKTAFEKRFRAKNFKSAKSFNFFLVRVGDKSSLHPGIWARVGFDAGKSIKPILMFVDKATYEQRFDLPAVVDDIVRKDLDFEFRKAFEHALRTAR